MGGIVRTLNTPLTPVQGNPLTLADRAITAGLVLLFFLLARTITRRFQRWTGNRLPIKATNRRLLSSTLNLTILFAGVYTSLSWSGY